MSEDNVWLAGRRQEQHALERIITTLQGSDADETRNQAVRGAVSPYAPMRSPATGPGADRVRGNPDNLRKAAAAKSAAAQARAERGLREMIRSGAPITFRALAQTAGVSLDFLYGTPDLRRRVEQLRDQQRTIPPAPSERADPDQPSSVIRTLTAQLAELKRRHRDEVTALRQALEAAQGENLELRRRLTHDHLVRPDD